MKTMTARFYGRGFCKALFLTLLMGIFSIHITLATTLNGTPAETKGIAPAPNEFMANSYHLQNSLGLVVRLVNPEQKEVNVKIVNRQGKVIFRKSLGNPSVYATIFNMKDLPNDDYTLIIQSVNYTYSKAFSLHTEIKRVVKTPTQDCKVTKQQAI